MDIIEIAQVGMGFLFTAMFGYGIWCIAENRRLKQGSELSEYTMIVVPIFMIVGTFGSDSVLPEAIFVGLVFLCAFYAAFRIYQEERQGLLPSWTNLFLFGGPVLALAAIVISIEGLPGPLAAIAPE